MKTLTRPDITHFLKIGATYVVHCICANVHEWKMRGRAGIGINCWVVARCIVADFRLQTEASEVRSQSSQSFVVRLVAWNGLGGRFFLVGAEIGNFDENFDPIFTHKKSSWGNLIHFLPPRTSSKLLVRCAYRHWRGSLGNEQLNTHRNYSVGTLNDGCICSSSAIIFIRICPITSSLIHLFPFLRCLESYSFY